HHARFRLALPALGAEDDRRDRPRAQPPWPGADRSCAVGRRPAHRPGAGAVLSLLLEPQPDGADGDLDGHHAGSDHSSGLQRALIATASGSSLAYLRLPRWRWMTRYSTSIRPSSRFFEPDRPSQRRTVRTTKPMTARPTARARKTSPSRKLRARMPIPSRTSPKRASGLAGG